MDHTNLPLVKRERGRLEPEGVTEELPDDRLEAASALALDEDSAFQCIVSIWGKVDAATRELVGARGEEQLVALLAASLSARVEHVSLQSDGLGYDIAVSERNFLSHLEVKSSTRQSRLSVFLSRNEFEVMRRDPSWALIAVTLS